MQPGSQSLYPLYLHLNLYLHQQHYFSPPSKKGEREHERERKRPPWTQTQTQTQTRSDEGPGEECVPTTTT